MPTILVLFNLQPNASIADYEAWAKAKDIPTVKSLKSVSDFRVLKMNTLLGTNNKPPYDYAELIEVNNMDDFFTDLGTAAVQEGAKQFNEFALNPIFIVADEI